jgi:CubicO group peptidase (beta-lactamase class C family)
MRQPAAADDPASLAMTAALQALVDRRQMAGAVARIWRGGELLHASETGYRDIAAAAPMTAGTLFRIASMTKPVVSLAALMLVEEGRLALGEPVARWLPELARPAVLNHPAASLDEISLAPRAITLEDLLTHRSGIAAGYTTSGPISEAYIRRLGSWLGTPMTPDEWLEAIGGLPLVHAPGERFHYGHSFDVLGLLIARIDGAPLGEVLRRRIFEPLGMHDTGFWPPPDRQRRLARLYREPGADAAQSCAPLSDCSFAVPPAPPVFESGGGGLISSADDYLKFVRLLLGGGEVDGVRLLTRATAALLTANRLSAAQRQLPLLTSAEYWTWRGFGLGVSVVLDGCAGDMPGAYGWPGAFGTWWMADPARDAALVFMSQTYAPLNFRTVEQLLAGERPAGVNAFRKLAWSVVAKEERACER